MEYYGGNFRYLFFLLFLCIKTSTVFSQVFPSGFSQVKIFSLTELTAMEFAPDGRLFVCQRNGTVRIYKNGSLLSTPFVTLTVDQNGERGISGITFDPDFSTNHYVYIYYTPVSPNIHNRLSRFTANGDIVVPGSELALLDAEPVTSVFHNGGGLAFGPDGKIYLSMGEDNTPSNAQNLETYKGKLLRINKDGSAPSDNPYFSSTSQITKKIWCLGLRNPYTLSFEPGTGRLFVNNVGADNWEEIHDGTAPGQNFGWPAVEGTSTNTAYVNPVFAYPHTSTGQHGCAITGGKFFKPSSTSYPSQYHGRYFYMEYCNGWIYSLTLSANNSYTNTVFATGLTTKNLALRTGPDGNLYYINRDPDKCGVYKIIHTNNNAPVITDQPDNITVIAGQPAKFEVSVSGTMPLTYQWRKNGVNISGANSYSYMIASVQNTDAAQYSVRVSNSSGTVTSNQASLTVAPYNAPPDATILTPTVPSYFRAGDTIYFSGDATDAEDGPLPASAFLWEVEFHHNNDHFHPGSAIPPGVKSGSFITSNSDHTTANVFYRLKLKVTDSNNLIDTAHVDIFPITSSVSLYTQPTGLQVTFAGQPTLTPFSILSVEGLKIQIGDVSPQTKNGLVYSFDYWQHGGSATQTITVGTSDSSYTAVYKQSGTADYELISKGASWKYLDNGTNQGTSWRNLSYSDGGWKTGDAQLGYGDGDETTVVGYGSSSSNKYVTTYFRKLFTVNDVNAISSLELSLMRDDGAVVYLNGTEVYRTNMPSGTITYTTLASTYIDGSSESSFLLKTLAKTGLVNGTNILAVEIHQNSRSSSDISFNLKLKAINSSTSSPSSCSGTGSIIREYWANVTGTTIAGVPVNSAPTSTSMLTSFEGPTNSGDYYGSRIRGYICPPVSGNYVFWIASDNNSELWLGTNEQPSSKVKIAYVNGYTTPRQWTKYPSQQSSPISLSANTRYYIEAIHREGTLGDNLAVGWQLPNQTLERPIPGSRLIPTASSAGTTTPAPCEAAITPLSSVTFCQGGSVVLSAKTASNFSYQWINNSSQISGATSSTYKATTAGDYQVKVTAADCQDWSAPVKITINTSLTAKITAGGPTSFCSGGSVPLFANTCSGYVYQWRKNRVDIPGATSATYIATTSGDYQVKIVQGSSVAWSAQQSVTANSCGSARTQNDTTSTTAAVAENKDFIINVYPNPSTGLFTVDICVEEVTEEMLDIHVVSLTGSLVYTKTPKLVSGCIKETIELSSSLASGIYILKLKIGDKNESVKLLLSGN